jgi:hypothetical protein
MSGHRRGVFVPTPEHLALLASAVCALMSPARVRRRSSRSPWYRSWYRPERHEPYPMGGERGQNPAPVTGWTSDRRPSKPVRSCSPRLGRFDSGAAPSQAKPAANRALRRPACHRAVPLRRRIAYLTPLFVPEPPNSRCSASSVSSRNISCAKSMYSCLASQSPCQIQRRGTMGARCVLRRPGSAAGSIAARAATARRSACTSTRDARRCRAVRAIDPVRRGGRKGSRADSTRRRHFEPIDPLSSEPTVVVDIVGSVLEG